jgi:hypothetical protein
MAAGFPLLPKVLAGSGAQISWYVVGSGLLSRQENGRGLKLTADLRLISRLRMSGAVVPLSLYTFMAWTGTTLLYL